MTAEDIQPDDLFLIIDVTAKESKNIQASELEIWLRGLGNISTFAYTASYILGSGIDGYVNLAYNSDTSSFANYSIISSQSYLSNNSLLANTASSVTFNNIPTSSFLVYSPNNGTASYAINTSTSSLSNVSNYLYYFGGDNGTASYAITARTIQNTVYAETASYFNDLGGVSLASASHAQVADYAASGHSDDTNFLNYNGGNNGTASYAMAAMTFANIISPQGIFTSTTQSSTIAQLDNVNVMWSTTNYARTPIEVIGTIDIPFTSSITTTGSIQLGIVDRNTGYTTTMDSSPISLNLSPTVGNWGSYDSGSISMPFTLGGEVSLYGSYLLFISASNNLLIDSNRNVKFKIATESDTFAINSAVPMTFDATSADSNNVFFNFTSTDGGPFLDTYVGINYTQSLGTQIFTIYSTGTNLGALNYFWSVNGIISASFSNNGGDFYYMSGVPNTTQYLACNRGGLSLLYSFVSSSLMYLDCDNNLLSSLPSFPNSMSYINCNTNFISNISNLPSTLSYFDCSNQQNNALVSLPSTLPYGLTVFLAGNNSALTTLPSVFTDSITTMSLDNNSSLINILSLPAQLVYLSLNNCSLITSLPAMPANVLYLSAQSCSFGTDPSSMDNITGQLASNAPTNMSGSLDLRGNGYLNPVSLTVNIPTLITYGWTVLHD